MVECVVAYIRLAYSKPRDEPCGLSEGRSFLINTFSCASLGDVGFYGMQDPPFWVTTIHPPYGHMPPHMWGPHFWLGHDSDTIYNDPTPTV